MLREPSQGKIASILLELALCWSWMPWNFGTGFCWIVCLQEALSMLLPLGLDVPNCLKLFLIHWLYFPAPPVCLSWVHIEGGPHKSRILYMKCYWLFMCDKLTKELIDFIFGISNANFPLFLSRSPIKALFFSCVFFLFLFLFFCLFSILSLLIK